MTKTIIQKAPWVENYRPDQSNLTIKIRENATIEEAKAAYLKEAFDNARTMVSGAVETLKNYDENSPARVKRLLEVLFSSNFLKSDSDALAELCVALEQIQDGLAEIVTIKVYDGSTKPGVAGYVNFRTIGLKPKQTDRLVITPVSIFELTPVSVVSGNIHVSTYLLDMPSNDVSETIIHEAAHRYAGARDYRYIQPQQAGKKTLTFEYMEPAIAVKNADTIARFCQYLANPELEASRPIYVKNKPGRGTKRFCEPSLDAKLEERAAAKRRKREPNDLGPC